MPLKLTEESLVKFVGRGQARILDKEEGTLFCGEIKSATIEGSFLRIEFAWVARGSRFSPESCDWNWILPDPKGWTMATQLAHSANLDVCLVTGEDAGRISLDYVTPDDDGVYELIVLFLPEDASNLDPTTDEGFL